MKKSIRFIFLYSLLLLSFKSSAQLFAPEEEMKAVFQTYGYLRGQEAMLQKIERQFPQLANDVSRARLTFSGRFGKAAREITAYVEREAPADIMQNLNQQLQQTTNNQQYNLSSASNFITEVSNRGKSVKIESPVFEMLLQTQFGDQPEKEIHQNYVKTYCTKGHAKAKKTDWQIKVPYSWLQLEGDRPNIIQKFVRNEGNNNLAFIMLLVKDLPSDAREPVSSSDWDEMLSAESYSSKDATGREMKFIYSQKMVFDGIAGGLVYIESTMPRLGSVYYTGMYQFMFYYKNQLYLLECCAVSADKNQQIKMAAKYKQLFLLVAHSIVVNTQYKR
jgi:hypothetical protein